MSNDRFKFRGLRYNGAGFIIGCLIIGSDYINAMIVTFKDGKRISYPVDPKTVGQCTALKDKNGVLIFEGDLLQYSHKRSVLEVMYEDASFMLKISPTTYKHFYVDDAGYIEIIGNIHEHPELIKDT